MKLKTRKALSLLVTLAMIIGLLAGSAVTSFATGEVAEVWSPDGQTQIGSYTTMQAAFDAAEQTGQYAIVKLVQNVSVAGTLDLSQDINLFLNGKTLTVPSGATLTGEIDHGSYTSVPCIDVFSGFSSGSGGSIVNNGTFGAQLSLYSSDITLSVAGGDVIGGIMVYEGTVNVSGGNAGSIQTWGTVNVTGGNLDFLGPENGTTTVSGGTIGDLDMLNNDGSPTVMISSSPAINMALFEFYGGNQAGIATVTISGSPQIAHLGLTISNDEAAGNWGSLTINGGYFNTDPQALYNGMTDAKKAHVTFSIDEEKLEQYSNQTDWAYDNQTYPWRVGVGGSGGSGSQTIAVSSVSLNTDSLDVRLGETASLTATVSPSNATNKTVTWEIDKTTVASIDGGTITTVGMGTATVTASAGGKSATCTVNVGKALLTVTAASKSIQIGEDVPQLTSSDFTVSGLLGDDTFANATVAYEGQPDSSVSGTFVITASGGDYDTSKYDVTYVNGYLNVLGDGPTNDETGSGSGGGSTSGGTAAGGQISGGAATDPQPVSETINVTTNVTDKTATISDSNIDAVIESDNADTVTLDVSNLSQNVQEIVVPSEMVSKIAEAVADDNKQISSLEIKLPAGTIQLDAAAVAAVAEQAGDSDLSIVLENISESDLNTAQQSAISDMDVQAVYDAYIVSGDKRVSDFDGGSAVITVAYTLKSGQNPGGITAWYVAEDGTRVRVPAKYDGKNVDMTVGHFSNYVIVYDEALAAVYPMTQFSDLDTEAWYRDGVLYVLDKGLMSGYGDGKFGPADNTSRAMLVQVLWNLAGKPTGGYAMDYSDVDGNAWYADAVRWATTLGIAGGYGGGKFGPTDNLTREQLATILYRYAKDQGKGFTGMWAFPLDYSDAANVSDYAYEALCWMTMNGIIQGNPGGTLDPQGLATRAQLATVLMRFADAMAK